VYETVSRAAVTAARAATTCATAASRCASATQRRLGLLQAATLLGSAQAQYDIASRNPIADFLRNGGDLAARLCGDRRLIDAFDPTIQPALIAARSSLDGQDFERRGLLCRGSGRRR
jgi:hypothetical protein